MKSEYAKLVAGLGEYYSKELTPSQIDMFSDDLMSLSPTELTQAIISYRRNPENKFFPLPGQLIGIIRPTITATDEANEVASAIINAVGKDGHTNPERAKQRIGELAWEVVVRFGGWKHICESLNPQNEGVFRAQIRGLAETVSKKALRGELDQKPALPQSRNVQNLIAQTMKGIE